MAIDRNGTFYAYLDPWYDLQSVHRQPGRIHYLGAHRPDGKIIEKIITTPEELIDNGIGSPDRRLFRRIPLDVISDYLTDFAVVASSPPQGPSAHPGA